MKEYVIGITMGAALALFLTVSESPLGLEGLYKAWNYDDFILCRKIYSKSNKRGASCLLTFSESANVDQVHCSQTGKGLACRVYVNDDFITPGFLKDLL